MTESTAPAALLERAENADFGAWYRERRRRENAREDRFHLNGPRDPGPPDVHYPHSLLQCHRKRRYVEANAPAERPSPDGHFWVGSAVETELVQPFLEECVAGPDQYVANGRGFEVELETDRHTLRLRGSTDPLITTASGNTLLPTEVKTKDDLSGLDGPSEHHLAQVHAYLYALDTRSDHQVKDALLVYVSKSTFAVRTYHVAFDEAFWHERVVPWMESLTAARESGDLPPADPEQGWECDYCRFRHRCGESDGPAADAPPAGFLPNLQYPRAAVETHVEAHDVALSPTVAAQHPDLAREHPVDDWQCPACGQQVAFGALDWVGSATDRPPCPRCANAGDDVRMRAPFPGQATSIQP